jgi:hypothetical protein
VHANPEPPRAARVRASRRPGSLNTDGNRVTTSKFTPSPVRHGVQTAEALGRARRIVPAFSSISVTNCSPWG